MDSINPTRTINISFQDYVQNKKEFLNAHLEEGLPDYAYGADYLLRKKIKSIPGFYALAKAITNTYVPYKKQELNLNCIAIGPTQFADVYELVTDCARRLGIGIPTVFVEPDPATINAYTISTESEAPLVVITSALLERYTRAELKTVIGHECGHIHNGHGIYETAAQILLGSLEMTIPGVKQILQLASTPLRWGLMTWSRAAEVTSDRASVICCDDVTSSMTAYAKFLYGASFHRADINIDAVLKQYDMLRATPVRLLEIDSSHPVPVRRLFAIKEFLRSKVLYEWRPEWKTSDMDLIDKQELDARCEKFISVTKSQKRR